MNIIKKPILTEKSLLAYKNLKHVTFEVAVNSTKTEIIKEIQSLYNVKITGANIISRLGKSKQSRTSRKLIKQADKKIVVLTISEKDEIEIFKS
jgi:ribosomal protein L23